MIMLERNDANNRGIAIIEMTLLIPILLGIIYLYIMLFLFLVQSGKCMGIMVDVLYSGSDSTINHNQNVNLSTIKQGTKESVFLHESMGGFDIELQMHRKEDNAVENIRRWKIASDTLRERRLE